MPFSISSKTRLTDRDLERFPGDALFDRVARAACQSLAVDVIRAVRLEQRGYRVWTQTMPAAITPKNRLLLGEPR